MIDYQELARDPREFLQKAERARRKVKERSEYIIALRQAITSINAVAIKQIVPGAVSAKYKESLIEKTCCKIADLESDMFELLALLEEARAEIYSVILEFCNAQTFKFLKLKYINGYTIREISNTLGITEHAGGALLNRGIREIKARAIQKV